MEEQRGKGPFSFAELYQRYKPSVVRVTVEVPGGDLANGAAFHIGNGWLATARHVVEGVKIQELAAHHYANNPTTVKRIVFHPNPKVDLALLETDFSLEHYMTKTTIMVGDREREKVDFIPIGGHLDDWIDDGFLLSKVMLIGFPPIPRSQSLVPVAVEAEVNAIVDRYDVPHPHFIISATPRGGFSGGPVFSEYGFLLGIMTEALCDSDRFDLGFGAVLTIEPLIELIDEEKIDCGTNSRFIRDLLDGKL